MDLKENLVWRIELILDSTVIMILQMIAKQT